MKAIIAALLVYAIQFVFFAYYYGSIGIADLGPGPTVITRSPDWFGPAWWLSLPLALIVGVSVYFRTGRSNLARHRG
jgi:hypothetical protein